MVRYVCSVVCCVSLVVVGCGERGGGSVAKSPKVESDSASDASDKPESSATGDSKTATNETTDKPTEAPLAQEVKLEGISVMVPSGWKKVTPANRIIEAEFSIPRVEGDEYDGRLTIMPAGGDNESNIDRWRSEFTKQEDLKSETLKVDGLDVTWVDIRGEWRGSMSAPQAKPQGPRGDYRMLAVIIPVSELNSYFIKFTGPKQTLAAQEEAFRTFVKSTHVRR